MKMFHLGDLHLGKIVHEINMARPGGDQEFWIDRFIEKVDEYQPDAVVIAGDVYDRKIPSPEAVVLLNRLLTALTERNKYVFIVPGNHDSAVRLSFAADLLQNQKIYIAGELSREMLHVTVPGDPPVTVWLLPYFYPKMMADETVLNQPDLDSYDSAAREYLKIQDIDESVCNILVAHQNVTAHGQTLEHSKSETVIGSVGEISSSAFDVFDYVALGHIHCAQQAGRDTVRYSGCPLYYDFTECNRDKSLTMVTVTAKTEIRIERIEMPLRHKMIRFEGTFDEVMAHSTEKSDWKDYYIQAVLKRSSVPSHVKEKINEAFGATAISVLVDHEQDHVISNRTLDRERNLEVPIEILFSDFYQEIESDNLDEKQCAVIDLIRDQQSRDDGEYIQNPVSMDEKDVQEVIDLLMKNTEEQK